MVDQWSCYPICVAVRSSIEAEGSINAAAIYEHIEGTKQRRLALGALRQLQHDHPVRWTDPIMTKSLLKRIRGMENVLYTKLEVKDRMLLYKIQHGISRATYFQDKRTANNHRADLIEDGAKGEIAIMRGPDHWRGESFNKSTTTPRTGRKSRRS